jgi:catechol 2,3-dioxygenase-like lactoylglutathione lyase family enzyme
VGDSLKLGQYQEQLSSCLEIVDNSDMLVSDIDHVQLAAPPGCEEAARNFFGRLLGLEEIVKPEALRSRGGCWFKLGSTELHIGVERDFHPARKAHPGFAVTDVHKLFDTLEKAAVPCAWDGAMEGVRRFYADDPWGNRLEFTERLSPKAP